MSKIEPGCLVLIKSCPNPDHKPYEGQIRVVGEPWPEFDGAWLLDPPVFGAVTGKELSFREWRLRRIDNPGDDEADLLLAPLPQQDKVPV